MSAERGAARLAGRRPAVGSVEEKGRIAAPARSRSAAPRQELERMLAAHFGVRRRVVGLERRPSPFASTHPLEELDVVLEDGTRLELLRKGTGSCVAHGIKPTFLRDPLREVSVYRALVGPAGLAVPVLYGVGGEGAPLGPWLLLERVPGRPLSQVGEIRAWEAAARWLGAFHSRFEGSELRPAGRVLDRNAAFHRRWLRRARALARLRGEPAGRRRALDALERPLLRAARRLAALPRTLLHGEFYASNVLVEDDGSGARVRPVDWEMAALGPGVVDLAALTSGGWRRVELKGMLTAYREGRAAAGTRIPDEAGLRRALDCARLCLAVQWLGWSARWSPPPEQARDWLAEAREAAERLEA